MKNIIIEVNDFSQAKKELAEIGVSNEGIEIFKKQIFLF